MPKLPPNRDSPKPEVELEPHDVARHGFERVVDIAVKSGPMHKAAVKPKDRPPSKRRVHKGKTRD